MKHPLEIEFEHAQPAQEIETRIRQELAELEKFYNRIVSCHAGVGFPEHPRQNSMYAVKLELHVPTEDAATPARARGAEIEGDGTERIEVHAESKDPLMAAHNAFLDARRHLEEFTGRRRRMHKTS